MKYVWIILVFICLAFSLAASERFVARIDNPGPADLVRFQNEGYDICGYNPGVYLDVLLNSDSYANLKNEFSSLHVTQTEDAVKANLANPNKDIPGYHTYQSMLDELLLLQAQYPSLVQVTTIGTGWGAQYCSQNIAAYQDFNHQIWAVKLSDNVTVSEDEPEYYFVGEHHAREPISTETVLGILNYLLDGYGSDPIITDVVNRSEIWFIPLLNPDGHKIVLDQSDVWWRKNIHDNNGNMAYDPGSGGNGSDGIDLNRNYGYKWGYLNATATPSDITYHGTEAFSELETQAFRDFQDEHNFIAGISYHTYGQYVLYPLGYMYDIIPPDQTEIQALANAMAASITAVDGTSHYAPMHSYDLYPVSGNSDDWAYGMHGTFAYTIEMADQFIPPASQVPTIVQNNLNAAMLLLTRENTKTLKGHVTNAYTGEPLRAMVFINGIDDSILKETQQWTDEEFGSFYRYLPVGLHQVSFICPGFQSETMTVQISDNMPTTLDVALLPVEPVDLLIIVQDANGMPLNGATFEFPEIESPGYSTDVSGQISIPGFFPGLYRYILSYPGVEQLHRMENIQGPLVTITLGAVTQVNEDFETDLSAWQTTGTWGRSSNQHYNGGYSLTDSPTGNYQGSVNSTCKLIQPLNLQNVLNASLQFYAKFNIALDGDYCELSYSTTGAAWRYLAYFNGVSDWQHYTFNLNHLIGSQVYLRFQMRGSGYGTADGIYIDDFKVFTSSQPSAVEDNILPIPGIKLSSYPNPFNQRLTVALDSSLKTSEPVSVKVYNLKGQLVKELYTGSANEIKQVLSWDGRDSSANSCANGIYFIRVSQSGKSLQSCKAVLLK